MSWGDGAGCGVVGTLKSWTLVLGRDAWRYGGVLEEPFGLVAMRGTYTLARYR